MLKRYKTNRFWNINANIVLADLVSTVGTALIIDAVRIRLPTKLTIVAVTALVDGTLSLTLFAILHSFANRSRGIGDLVRVQIHRWVLSPLHYLVGATLQLVLLTAGVRAGITVVVAYVTSMVLVRTVHSLYGMRTGLFR